MVVGNPGTGEIFSIPDREMLALSTLVMLINSFEL